MILRETERLHSGARVLDAAVGLGQLAERLQRRGFRAFGIDAAFGAALHVRKNSSIPVVVGDLTRLPFRDRSFDGVTSGETLEHLDNDAGAVQDIYLTTSPRPGGEPGTPFYTGARALGTRCVVRKAGRAEETGVVFEHLRLSSVVSAR